MLIKERLKEYLDKIEGDVKIEIIMKDLDLKKKQIISSLQHCKEYKNKVINIGHKGNYTKKVKDIKVLKIEDNLKFKRKIIEFIYNGNNIIYHVKKDCFDLKGNNDKINEFKNFKRYWKKDYHELKKEITELNKEFNLIFYE